MLHEMWGHAMNHAQDVDMQIVHSHYAIFMSNNTRVCLTYPRADSMIYVCCVSKCLLLAEVAAF